MNKAQLALQQTLGIPASPSLSTAIVFQPTQLASLAIIAPLTKRQTVLYGGLAALGMGYSVVRLKHPSIFVPLHATVVLAREIVPLKDNQPFPLRKQPSHTLSFMLAQGLPPWDDCAITLVAK